MTANENLLEWNKEGTKRGIERLEKEYIEEKKFTELKKLQEIKQNDF